MEVSTFRSYLIRGPYLKKDHCCPYLIRKLQTIRIYAELTPESDWQAKLNQQPRLVEINAPQTRFVSPLFFHQKEMTLQILRALMTIYIVSYVSTKFNTSILFALHDVLRVLTC